jgi:hypothetical protein
MRAANRILPPALLLTALCAATSAPALATTGRVTHSLQFIQAVLENGSPAPMFDAACKKQLATSPTKFVGMPVTSTYNINPTTLLMSATSSFSSPVPTQPLQVSVPLNPLGIAGTYAFGTFRPAQVPSVYAVLFSIDKAVQKSKSTFVVFGPKNRSYNCVVSSDRAIATSAEASRFKSR